MRILHTVEFYPPSIGGTQEVVRQISERLVQRGHAVTVATSRLSERLGKIINGVRVKEFDISGNAVRGYNGDTTLYQDFLRKGDFDIMMNYAAQEWTADLAFPLLNELPYVRVFAPCGFSAFHRPEYAGYFSQMPAVLRAYDHLVFHAEDYQDINFARQHDVHTLSLIPNGASEQEFSNPELTFRKRYGIPQKVPMILTVGSHTKYKGHHRAIEVLRLLGVPRAVLVIIGNSQNRSGCLPECEQFAHRTNLRWLGFKRVLLLNPPRQDVVAAYHAADLFFLASNIELSPIVLFEALASKTPFVSLACGNAAEIVSKTGGGLVLPTIQKDNGLVDGDPVVIAASMTELLKNPSKCSDLAELGHKVWKERFTWEHIVSEYETLYQVLIEHKTNGRKRNV
jgi:glycosyltransferase involved in cell wall biosynthesis